jgi:uncharacterized protein (TIGR03089 family)
VHQLTRLLGPRDPAQPLLTLLDGPARVELSGATAANWVAKTANLLDAAGRPARVGLLLPLHWQTVALLLGGVASGATVVVAAEPAELADTEVAFVESGSAEAALAAGADDVLVLSGHPLGARLPSVPAGVADYAVEVPGYADHWGGPVPTRLDLEAGGAVLPSLPELALGTADRVLTAVRPADPDGLAALLAVLRCGAALVLVPEPAEVDLPAVAAQEGVTATLGVEVAGLPALPTPAG